MAPEVKSFRGRQEGEDLRIKIEKAVSIIPRKRVTTNRTAGLGGRGVDFERHSKEGGTGPRTRSIMQKKGSLTWSQTGRG